MKKNIKDKDNFLKSDYKIGKIQIYKVFDFKTEEILNINEFGIFFDSECYIISNITDFSVTLYYWFEIYLFFNFFFLNFFF
jgi:hypothetical protein